MKILFLCTYFYPDSTIAATRATFFTKYLIEAGHDVTVICAGKIYGKESLNQAIDVNKVKAYFYKHKNSIQDGLFLKKQFYDTTPHNSRIPKKIDNSIFVKIFKLFWGPYFFYSDGKKNYINIKRIIDQNLQNENFDLIFATYGHLENIYAGEYAKRKFNIPLVFDFRDLINSLRISPIRKWLGTFTEQKYYNVADAYTTISQGLKDRVQTISTKKVYYIPNGYASDVSNIIPDFIQKNNLELIFCYTGIIFHKKRNLGPLFSVLESVFTEQEKSYTLKYAGTSYNELQHQVKPFPTVEKHIVNLGHVTREKSYAIQNESDFFIVATWNTIEDQGIMTGKFYEALRARKPIIALVSGDLKNSEMRQIVEKYDLGVCYEEADHENTYPKLYKYIKEQQKRKEQGKELLYQPNKEAFEKFHYENLTKELINVFKLLLN